MVSNGHKSRIERKTGTLDLKTCTQVWKLLVTTRNIEYELFYKKILFIQIRIYIYIYIYIYMYTYIYIYIYVFIFVYLFF